jgi:outer membrane lipopolysaccharide assembly protein LptE/RlpB
MKSTTVPSAALRYAVVALILAALASACGFRPRGNVSLPEDFRQVYVKAPLAIADELAIFLDSGGATVVKARGEADAVIDVQSDHFEDRVTTVDAVTGKAREYELLYILDFSIRMKDGRMLVAPDRVIVKRVYIFDQNAVIGSLDNVAALRGSMQRDAAEGIIRRAEAALRPQ